MFACDGSVQTMLPQRRAWLGCGAHERRREAQGTRPRAQRGRELTHRGCLSAESEANEASSAMGPRDRASQGSRRDAPTAEHKRRSQAKPAFAWGPSKQVKSIKWTDEERPSARGRLLTANSQQPTAAMHRTQYEVSSMRGRQSSIDLIPKRKNGSLNAMVNP